MDALVTNSWNRFGYNICRSLGSKGLKVVAGSDIYIGMSSISKYANKVFLHPPIHKDYFLNRIIEVLEKYNPKVLIPSDEDLFIFSKNLETLRQFKTIIPISDYEIIDTLNKKNRSAFHAKSIGVPIPVTLSPTSEDDVKHFSKEVGSPVVLKLVDSSGARGVFFLNESNVLQKINELYESNNIGLDNLILQQYVKGDGYGVSMLFNQGVLKAKFTHKRIREKNYTGGPSTMRVATKNGQLEEYAEEILSKINYHGVAMIEFKYNEETGQGWFIEANPRFWGSLALAIQSGVDFPYLLYKMAIDGDIDSVFDYKIGTTTKWILGDILAIFDQIIKTKKTLKISQFFLKADGYDDLYLDDPLPFFIEPISFLLRKLILAKENK
jgi:predicted ATP-grasp superfamily ATP-dependent carboligase